MYSSGYSQVAKHSPQAQKRMQYHSKSKSCGYYMRIVFFFSSLIQSLIIVSLVLFLVYGKKYDSVDTVRIQDLEESFSRLSIENVVLRQQRKNLTTLLNKTVTAKTINDWELVSLRYHTNASIKFIKDGELKHQQCMSELFMCKSSRSTLPRQPITMPGLCNCGLAEQLNAKFELVSSNFTQTTQRMRREMDEVTKERDNLNLEAIRLRRDKAMYEKAMELLKHKCKEDLVQSLSGIANVTSIFLKKIESLYPSHDRFLISCEKQKEHLEQIRTNCTSLSRDVEDKFQRYLNNVGDQVSSIQSENTRLKAENWRLSGDYRWCSQNRTGMIQQHKQDLSKLQQQHDEAKEKVLMDKVALYGDIDVLTKSVNYKTKEIDHLTEQIRQLNMSCMARPGLGGLPSRTGLGWPGMTSGGTGGLGRTGIESSYGTSGLAFNKPGSTGTGSLGSSLFPSGSGSSTGTGYNKPGSTGAGSSSSSLFPSGSGSSTGSGYNKPGSTGTGSLGSSLFPSGSGSSTGTGYNKPGSTGTGSTGFGSTGLNPSGSGSVKPAQPGRASSPYGSSSGSNSGSSGSVQNPGSSGTSLSKPATSGSTGQPSKSGPGSSSFPWFGGSSSGQAKPGSGTGKGPSSGTGYGGSSYGGGRSSGLGGGQAVSVAQHLQILQRLINPAAPQENQELARILG